MYRHTLQNLNYDDWSRDDLRNKVDELTLSIKAREAELALSDFQLESQRERNQRLLDEYEQDLRHAHEQIEKRDAEIERLKQEMRQFFEASQELLRAASEALEAGPQFSKPSGKGSDRRHPHSAEEGSSIGR